MKLEVIGLTKSFEQKEVLHGISLSVQSGSAFGLLGRNGAGKTTTIRILMDVFKSDAGTILLDGKVFQPQKERIGYLPEERGLYPKKKVREQLQYMGMLRGLSKKEAKVQTTKWLEKLGVLEYENRKLETLSKGNQQKVQLAQTLLCEPNIIILDEPFSGLDPVNAQVLKDVIKEQIKEGKLIIFSSHQMSQVEEFCDEIAILNHGDLVLSGNLKQLKLAFGKNRLVLSCMHMTSEKLGLYLQEHYNDILEVESILPQQVIMKTKVDDAKKIIMQRLVQDDVDIEFFGLYEPSLHDIFVKKAGDDQ